MSPQEAIQKFLQRQVLLVHGEHSVCRFEVFHASPESADRIQVFPFERGETKTDELACEIYDIALADAKSRANSTPERYGVCAFIETDTEPVGQANFVIEPQNSRFAALFEGSEEPNQRGQTGQLMRHTERMHQMMLQLSDVTLGRMMQENIALRAELQKYRDREDELRKLSDAILDARDERELRNASELMKAKRQDQLGGMLLSMAPAVLGGILGQKGLTSAKSTGELAAIKHFMGELNEKELTGILGALTPAHQMALLEVYRRMKADETQADNEKPKILRAVSTA